MVERWLRWTGAGLNLLACVLTCLICGLGWCRVWTGLELLTGARAHDLSMCVMLLMAVSAWEHPKKKHQEGILRDPGRITWPFVHQPQKSQNFPSVLLIKAVTGLLLFTRRWYRAHPLMEEVSKNLWSFLKSLQHQIHSIFYSLGGFSLLIIFKVNRRYLALYQQKPEVSPMFYDKVKCRNLINEFICISWCYLVHHSVHSRF